MKMSDILNAIKAFYGVERNAFLTELIKNNLHSIFVEYCMHYTDISKWYI